MKHLVSRFGIAPMMLAFGMLLGAALTGTAWAYQTHMHNALNDLNAANTELNAALPDKAGHRVNAMNFITQAISEVKQGIVAGHDR